MREIDMHKNPLSIFITVSFCLVAGLAMAQSTEPTTLSFAQDLNSNSKTFSRFGLTKQERELDEMIRKEAVAFRQAADKGSRDNAEERLTELLGRDYDDRLQGYEDNLNRLEQQLQEMRDILQKRRAAKADMIRLRVKVLEAESEDLGWPERPRGISPLSKLYSRFRESSDSKSAEPMK